MATEKRLIDANALLNALGYDPMKFGAITPESTFGIVLNAPTVYAVEVVHGRWAGYHEADIGYDEYGVRCSNCNFEVEDNEVDFIMNYCPNCGAKMDGDGNG